ncbi:MAG: hypothetical protein LBH48_03815 [Bifidobacteriaceae bacterium]|nr:hypothetical protein [Bifidobacteriaceae bacterium]
MSASRTKESSRRIAATGLALSSTMLLVGCGPDAPDVATLSAAIPDTSASSNPAPVQTDGDQYDRAQALLGCLTEGGLPAKLTMADGGEAQLDWEAGHEVLARDLEQWTTIQEGAAGDVFGSAVHQAFMSVETDDLTNDLAPSLWVDGKDQTTVWVACLETSGYTNPTAALEEDPGMDQLLAQRMADAANDWIACARENGLPKLVDVTPDSDSGTYGPHVEIPLDTGLDLMRSVLEACPIYTEDIVNRRMDGDATLDIDIAEGRVAPNPLVLAQEPEGMQEAANLPEGYDFESGDGKRYLELNEVLFEAGFALEEEYARHQDLEEGVKTPAQKE